MVSQRAPLDSEPRRPGPRWFSFIWGPLLLVLGFVACLLYGVYLVSRPHGDPAAGQLIVDIPSGFSVNRIGERLARSGVIRSARHFSWYVRVRSLGGRLQAGEYSFEGPVSLDDVVQKLSSGQVHLRRLTIQEGLALDQISEILVNAGWAAREAAEQLLEDPAPIADLDGRATDLEGYLFPDTYLLRKGATAEEVVMVMTARFREVWTPDRSRRADELGMSLREIVSLASLIEKETALASERPLVSSVFHNRLRKNIRLACDPTVIYAVKQVKEYDGVLHQSDLELDSPYNTYLYPGLPPGPISNASEASLEAALFPGESDFLFFVSRNDGSHVFSETYSEHRKAVETYQR